MKTLLTLAAPLILAVALLIASVPAWYWMIRDYRRDAGKQAQAECSSLADAVDARYYDVCMVHRVTGQ